MKVALVHDWLVNLSGAERVLGELHEIFPDAPIYTLLAHKKFVRQYFPRAHVRPSFLQLIPGITRFYKYFFFLMPTAIESFDLSGYDLVISSSSIFSKGLVLKPRTRHICYCYSPTRQLWDLHHEHGNKGGEQKIFTKISQHFLRVWDRQASDRVDEFVAISEHVKNRIKKYYRRDAEVIYPPVNLVNYAQDVLNAPGDYFLIVSRLFPHKNIDIVIEAFNKLNLPLVIIGKGPEKEKLERLVERGKDIKLLGFVPDEKLPGYYRNCKAFIMPQEEDFGITPVEAMAYGKPVLALRRGGATETVVEGMSGEFFDDAIPESLADGIRRLNNNYKKYDPAFIRISAGKFSRQRFRENIDRFIAQ